MGTPTASQTGGIVSSFTGGAIPGALSVAWLPDRFGRRKTVFIGACISVLGCALQGGAKNIPMMIAGRFIAGVAVGLLSAVVPMYCSEIATAQDRGKLSGLLQWMLSWGFLVAQWLGYGCFKVKSDFQCKHSWYDVYEKSANDRYRALSSLFPSHSWAHHRHWHLVPSRKSALAHRTRPT